MSQQSHFSVASSSDNKAEVDSQHLRGFRKRWLSSDFRSPGPVSVGSESLPSELNDLPLSGISEVDSFDQLRIDLEDDGWSHVKSEADYAPSSDPEEPLQDDGQVAVSGDPGCEYAWKHEAMNSATKRLRLFSDKYRWESSDLNGVFGHTDIFAGTIVSGYKYAFAPHHEGIYDVLNSTTASGSTETAGVDDTPPPVKRIVLLGSRRETSDEDMRRIALAKLRDLVMGDPAATRLGLSLQHILHSGGMSHVIEQSFSDCFRAKASSTLQKRANSLWKLSLTLAELGSLQPLRFSEEQLYNALSLMREKKLGATSAQHVIEALHFLDSTAGFTMCNIGAVISGRCRGVARDMFLSKDPLSQKRPLSVRQVEWLEQLMQNISTSERCIVGQLLFCIHTCCRWKDAQRVKRIYVEHGKGECLIHADAISSKTSLTLDAKTRFLPYVAIGSGLLGQDWATPWLQARVSECIIDTVDDFFLPSFSERNQCWINQPMSASEACGWLREFLLLDQPSLETELYGSHSCKCTMLTWVGRSTSIVFSPTERRLLGHHLDPALKSMLVYSRESYTSLYAKIMKLFTLIRSREFDPDQSATDRVLQYVEGGLPEKPVGEVNSGVAAEPSADLPEVAMEDIESDSDSSVGSDIETNCLTMLGAPSGSCLEADGFEGLPPHAFKVHCRSGLRHVLNEDGFLLCGRQLTANFKDLSEISSPHHIESCSQCLKAFQRQSSAVQSVVMNALADM